MPKTRQRKKMNHRQLNIMFPIYYHFQRIIGLANNLKTGSIISNISFSNFGRIGYGVNIFYPWLTLLPFQIIFKINGDIIKSYYLGLMLYFLVSFIISHYSMKKVTGDTKLAVLFSIIYNFSTYRLIEVFTRSSLAEYIASIFLPLCFMGFYEIFFGDGKTWKPLAVGMSLIILSHILTTFMCVIFFVLILIIFVHRVIFSKERLLNLFRAVVITVLCTSFFTVPFLLEEKFQKYGVPDPTILKGQNIGDLFISSFANTSGRLIQGNNYNIGIFLIIFLLLGLLMFKKLDRFYRSIYGIYLISFLATTNLFTWSLFQNTPLQVIQYPFRILMFSTMFGSIIAAEVISKLFSNQFENEFLTVLMTTIVITGGLWTSSVVKAYNMPHSLVSAPQLVISKDMLKQGIPDTYVDQYVPLREQKRLSEIKQHQILINGKKSNQIPKIRENGNQFSLHNVKSKDKIDLPFVRYEFTTAKVNGHNVPVEFSNRGTVQIVASRDYRAMEIELSYGNKILWLWLTLISFLGLLYLLMSGHIFSIKHNRNINLKSLITNPS